MRAQISRHIVMVLFAFSVVLNAQNPNKNPNKDEPPILGPHWARGLAQQYPATTSPNLLYHGGPILPSTAIQAIFWGSTWGTSPGDKITGLNKWFEGVGDTKYAATVDEYTDGTGQRVGSSVTYLGYVKDTTSAPNTPSTSQVLAEVCRRIANPRRNGFYPVYIDHSRNGNYCAYHSWGACNGTKIQFAFFWKLDGDAGCNPQSTVSGQSEGLQALANVTGHELSETRSDPRGNAWYDASGEENADKCAWSFAGPYVDFSNGSKWKIQGNWSNYAYNHHTGYANSSGQHACVDGTNYPGPYMK